MKKILIQENDKSIRDVLKLALEAEGFKAVIVADINKQLLQIIHKINPAVVVLDFICNGSNAILMRRMIRSAYPTLPVLAISCNNNIKTCFAKFGFEGYIAKPFDLDVLFDTLNCYTQRILHIPKIPAIQTLQYQL